MILSLDPFYYETSRTVLRLSIPFIHFLVFCFIQEGDKRNLYSHLELTIIFYFVFTLCSPSINTEKYIKVSAIIFLIYFLLVPILHTLTKEICTDTIFFWYSVCQIIFVGNSVAFSIYNRKPIKRIYNEKEVLELEESINIPNPYKPSMVYGNVAATIGIILLISRFKHLSSVFCFLCFSMIYYIGLPVYQENYKMHKDLFKIFIWVGVISNLIYIINRILFYIYIGLIIYLYGTTYLIKHIV